MTYLPEIGIFTSDYLFYIKGDKINNYNELDNNRFYQIDEKNENDKKPTDANVYYRLNEVFYPISTFLFTNDENHRVIVVRKKNYEEQQREKVILSKDLLVDCKQKKNPRLNPQDDLDNSLIKKFEHCNIYNVYIQERSGSILSDIPGVGPYINTTLGYVPFSNAVTNFTEGAVKGVTEGTLTAVKGVTEGARTAVTKGVLEPVYRRKIDGGIKKRKTKKNKYKKNSKKQRKTKK